MKHNSLPLSVENLCNHCEPVAKSAWGNLLPSSNFKNSKTISKIPNHVDSQHYLITNLY